MGAHFPDLRQSAAGDSAFFAKDRSRPCNSPPSLRPDGKRAAAAVARLKEILGNLNKGDFLMRMHTLMMTTALVLASAGTVLAYPPGSEDPDIDPVGPDRAPEIGIPGWKLPGDQNFHRSATNESAPWRPEILEQDETRSGGLMFPLE